MQPHLSWIGKAKIAYLLSRQEYHGSSDRRMQVDLNLFTNAVANRVEQLPLFETIRSFSEVFDPGSFQNIRVFCHAAPLSIKFEDLYARLRDGMPGRKIELYSTRGLADGYVRSLHASDAAFVFQLEHDYCFDAGHVKHSVSAICQAMRNTAIPYLRFNIRPNFDNELDRISEFRMNDILCCNTVIFSNHPHFLDRAYALKHYVPVIDPLAGGSRGIEDRLTGRFRLGWIYGPYGHLAVIRHIDGRERLKKWRRQRLSWRLAEFISRHRTRLRDHFGWGYYGRVY